MENKYDIYLEKYGLGKHKCDETSYVVISKIGATFINETGSAHRLDGPAFTLYTGSEYWYIRGVLIDDQIREWAYQQNVNLDNLTEDDKLLIKLVWG